VSNERINEIIEKIPITLLLVCYFGYLGFDYYSFIKDESSPLLMKSANIEAVTQSNKKIEERIKKLDDFLKSLDAKKVELRRLAQELHETQGTLSETIDVPAIMKMTLTEAEKVGLRVLSLTPSGSNAKEYYVEQTFQLTFRGVYIQLIAFLKRLSAVRQIVRVDTFKIKPLVSNRSRFVELDGTLEIKTYKYLGSKADSLDPSSSDHLNKSKDSRLPSKSGLGGGT
jgi:Tfp pilus assembly protein PilO